MPRPKKSRVVCDYPQTSEFMPADTETAGDAVILTLEEYETIRLIDKEGFSQEQCGEFMQIARTTVQQIYADARRKLAEVLVEGLPLRIEGGDYRLCRGGNRACRRGDCRRGEINRQYSKPKGDNIMRIAITYENGKVFQHFGHTEQFKRYDVENGKIVSAEVVPTNGSGHGALAGVLSALKVDAVICGGIGGGAQAALADAGIKLYGGVSGDADEAAAALIEGRLVYNANVRCDHHDHHGEGHSCGSHGCGSHNCG